MNKNHSI
jgi:hypothetical protein